MRSPLGPRTGDARVKLKMGIFRVEKTCRLIRLTLASLLMNMWKGIAPLMVTI
jgi:hypothetical protein